MQELHTQQQEALDKVKTWLAAGCPSGIFKLMGWAGTGKSTIAKQFPDLVHGPVIYAAYTGKAAHVLASKGCPASTIHRLIYTPRGSCGRMLRKLEEQLLIAQHDGLGNLVRKLEAKIRGEKEKLKSPKWDLSDGADLREAALLVIDEVSMVGEKLAHDLMSFGTPILALGDPGQLPPVKASSSILSKGEPDVMLTDIHRQAEGSEILDLATKVRRGETLPYGESVVRRGDTTITDLITYDQILVGKNATRQSINRMVRKQLGFEGLPKPGDKLVCLRNNHDLGIMNGSQWVVQDSIPVDGDQIILNLMGDDGVKVDVISWTHLFEGRESPHFGANDCELFDYGYALTVHKSQGSQWPYVFIVDESEVFRQNRNRWLYTAVTRASEKVTISR